MYILHIQHSCMHTHVQLPAAASFCEDLTCVACAWPVTPEQLKRPSIGQNVSCAFGDWLSSTLYIGLKPVHSLGSCGSLIFSCTYCIYRYSTLYVVTLLHIHESKELHFSCKVIHQFCMVHHKTGLKRQRCLSDKLKIVMYRDCS